MRKPLIVIMSIIFTGALLIYTAQANLNLLQQVYVNPQYVIFGMLALEGGVLYWLGYYLLHWNANHKAIALTMVVIDFILSMIGFFMDLNLRTGDQIKTALPPILIVMTFDVIINVGVGLLIHFLAHGQEASLPTPAPRDRLPQPKDEPARFAQTSKPAKSWPGVKSIWSGFVNGGEQAPQTPSVTVTPVQPPFSQSEALERLYNTDSAAFDAIVEEIRAKQQRPKATAPLDAASQPGQANGHGQ